MSDAEKLPGDRLSKGSLRTTAENLGVIENENIIHIEEKQWSNFSKQEENERFLKLWALAIFLGKNSVMK